MRIEQPESEAIFNRSQRTSTIYERVGSWIKEREKEDEVKRSGTLTPHTSVFLGISPTPGQSVHALIISGGSVSTFSYLLPRLFQ